MGNIQINNNSIQTITKVQFNNNLNSNTITHLNKIQFNNGNSIQTIFNYSPNKIFGVAIDENNSNPLTRCTYTDDAVGMTKGSSAWDLQPIFKDIKPCELNANGSIKNYLNPNNYNRTVDDVASGVGALTALTMSEFKKFAYSIKRVGAILYVKITDSPNPINRDSTEDWCFHAFSKDAEGDCSHVYIGCFLGRIHSDGKLYSCSGGIQPTVLKTWSEFQAAAIANGAGYQMWGHHQITALQCLFVIRYGSTDSQTALGRGYVDGNSALMATGGTNTKGMYFGERIGKQQMKFAGIEDFWGNLYQWYGGLVTNANRDILTAYSNFNTTGSGYVNNGQGATADVGGYLSTVQGTSRAGFVAKATVGSATTFYADYADLYASRLPFFGGIWVNGSGAGAFNVSVTYSALNSSTIVGSRLCFLKKG